MARPLRIAYPGAVYHVTGRGNERELRVRHERDSRMAEPLEQHGYAQIADHLGLHFTSISRVLRTSAKVLRK